MSRPILVREPCVWCGRKTARRGILSDGSLVVFCRRCHPGNSQADFRKLAVAIARLEGMKLKAKSPTPAPKPADWQELAARFVWSILPTWARVLVGVYVVVVVVFVLSGLAVAVLSAMRAS